MDREKLRKSARRGFCHMRTGSEELVSQTCAVKLLPKGQEDGCPEDSQYNFVP